MVQFMNQTGSEMAKVFGRAAESGEDLDAHRWSKSFSLGCNSIDTLNFGCKAGCKTGPSSLGHFFYQSTTSLDMSQNSLHDLAPVLDQILGQKNAY